MYSNKITFDCLVSNQFNFICLRSCKDCYKRQSGVVGACGKAHLGVSFYVGQLSLRVHRVCPQSFGVGFY